MREAILIENTMIELLLNNQSVDLGTEDSLIAITKQFEALENPTLYFSDWSNTITLPYTDNNCKIFNSFYRHDGVVSNNTLNPTKKIDMKLIIDGELVMSGYAKLDNANAVLFDNHFEVTLFSSFGLVMNELSKCVFDVDEAEEEKYLIEPPFEEQEINRFLVKSSFEQERHDVGGDDILDYIGFVPSYQGLYSDFNTSSFRFSEIQEPVELDDEHDEHYMREFRSYYQQPFMWVDNMWNMLQQKCREITDYSIVLHPSWFNKQNPYYTDLIYTLPSLMNTDESFNSTGCVIDGGSITYNRTQVAELNQLTRHNGGLITPNLVSGDNIVYENGVFNPQNKVPYTAINAEFYFALGCLDDTVYTQTNNRYCRIKESNPIYLKIKAVDAVTNEEIDDASYTYMLHSGKHLDFTNYDEEVNLGNTNLENPNSPSIVGIRKLDGYWWGKNLNLSLKVLANKPFRLRYEVYTNVNVTPFETCFSNVIPTWDLLWADKWNDGLELGVMVKKGNADSINHLRSHSILNMNRLFPSDTTILSVLLNYSKMFGLYWDISEQDNTITILTRDAYFRNRKITDWTDKVDISTEFKMSPLSFDKRYVYFNVEDGDCLRLREYQNKYKYGYGSKKIDTGYDFNSDDINLFEGISPSIISQKAQGSININTTDPTAPNFRGYHFKTYVNETYVDNDAEGSNAGISGAFYFRNRHFVPDERVSSRDNENVPYVKISDDSKKMILFDEYCWCYDTKYYTTCSWIPEASTILNGYSLHFEAPKEYYFKHNEKPSYIYELYWKNWLDERYSVQNKLVECYVYDIDLKSFKFNDFVVIDNVIYHVNKIIDYNVTDRGSKTKVELIQVYDLDKYSNGQRHWSYIYCDDLNATTEEQFIEVNSSTEGWTVESMPNWLYVYRDGHGIKYVAYNTPIRPRIGSVTLRNDDGVEFIIRVQQNASVSLFCEKQNILFNKVGGTDTVDVYSALPLSVQDNAFWLSVSLVNKDGYWYHYRVVCQQNFTTIDRTAMICFMNSQSEYIEVAVTQLGNDVYTFTDDEPMFEITDGDGILSFGVNDVVDHVETTTGFTEIQGGVIGDISVHISEVTEDGVLKVYTKGGNVIPVPFKSK